MKNESLRYIQDETDNEIVDLKIDDLVEVFKKNNEPGYVRSALETYFNLIYRLGYCTGENQGIKLANEMLDKRG